jgi:hypothetical protein
MPSKEGAALPVNWVLWPLRGSSKAFDSAPLNPWFRLAIIGEYTLTDWLFWLGNKFVYLSYCIQKHVA